MLTYKEGNVVGKGTYWDLVSGRRVDVFSDAVLAGTGDATYIKIPSVVMLALSPFMGLLYAVLMPFIGIATVAVLAGRSVVDGLNTVAAKSISFGWRPGHAFLAGKKKKSERK
jgi:hypothetical protein